LPENITIFRPRNHEKGHILAQQNHRFYSLANRPNSHRGPKQAVLVRRFGSFMLQARHSCLPGSLLLQTKRGSFVDQECLFCKKRPPVSPVFTAFQAFSFLAYFRPTPHQSENTKEVCQDK